MSIELVSGDGDTVKQNLFAENKDIQTLRVMLGQSTVELKAVPNPDGSTAMELSVRYTNTAKTNQIPPWSPQQTSLSVQPSTDEQERAEKKVEWIKKMRGWIMLLATLFASMAFQAGLNPPGGFWQDNQPYPNTISSPSTQLNSVSTLAEYLTVNSTANASSLNSTNEVFSSNVTFGPHQAGHAVLDDMNHGRYRAFCAVTTVAFAFSLAIVISLTSQTTYTSGKGLFALRIFLMLDMILIAVAYAIGTNRDVKHTYYTFIILIAACLYSVFDIGILKI